jgi:hypothetical protein
MILPTQSFQSLLDTRCGTNGRNPEDGKDWTILAIVQQVLKVALLFPILGRILPRDLSPLKPVLKEKCSAKKKKINKQSFYRIQQLFRMP